MAGEEKKKPDLRSRLNKGTNPGAGATASTEPASVPQGEAASPISAHAPYPDAPVASPMSSDLSDDIAVPDFIKQQRADQAAAEARVAAEARAAVERAAAAERAAAEQARLNALAADPFSSSATAGAQDIRLVIDEKSVSDSEVGRKNTGAIITVVTTGLIALGAGYLVGDFKASKAEETRTRGAITDIRRAVDTAGTTITTLKDKVDHAAVAAGVQEEGQAAAPQPVAASVTVDEALVTWFTSQSPDPPLGPDAYAGRVGRLRPDLVAKLMKVQIGLEQVWRELQRHQALSSGPGLTIVRSSLADAQRVRTEYQRLAVAFAPGRGDSPPVMATLVQVTPTPGQEGVFSLSHVVPGAPARSFYITGDLAAATTIGTVIIPVAPGAGLAGTTVSNLNRPWGDYAARLRSLKQHVDQLQQDHHSLGEALSRAGVN